MRLSTWIPLGLAIVLGLAAAFVARSMMAKNKGGAAPQALQRVVVARANISPGSEIKLTDLTLSPVPGDTRPEGAFADLNELSGRVATSPLVKGQIVAEPMLAPRGAQAGVQNLVGNGMRLITVEVNEFSSLAGMLAPGCRVDILASMPDPETKDMMARTIVENVKVVAVGQRVAIVGAENQPKADDPGFRSVTLEVSPKEAEFIHVATTGGRPWMVLRGTGDNGSVDSTGITLAELRTGNKPPDAQEVARALAQLAPPVAPATTEPAAAESQPRPKRQRTITFIRGGKSETITIDVNAPEAPESMTSVQDPAEAR